ncbi:MAG: ABC transporter substrate-binding protein [Pseudomonadota bacterium]
MQKNKLFIGIAILVAILGIGLWRYNQKNFPSEEQIKIGVLVPLTGAAASYGENSKMGAALAVEEFTAGHPGLKVELIPEDSRGEAAQGVKAAQKLLNIDHVVAVVGCVTSGVTLAVAPSMNEKHVPIISPGGSAPNIRDAGDFVFRTWPSDVFEAATMAEYLKSKKIQRLAILRVNNEYGLAMEKALSQKLSPPTQVVASESFDQGAREMRTQLFKIKEAQPDALFFVGFPEAAIALAPSLSAVGLQIPLFATSGFEDPQVPAKTGGVLDGTVYAKPLADSPAAEAFRRAYKERYKVDPGITSDTAYDAASLVLRAISAVASSKQPVTGDVIRDYLLHVRDYAGASGVLTFDDKGDVIKPVGLFSLHNGQYEKLP